MPLQLPCRLCADVADCLVGSPSLQAAYDAISSRFSESLLGESRIFVKTVSGWTRVAGQGDSERERRWLRSLERLSVDQPVVIRLGNAGEPPATALWIAGAEPVAVVVEGDWTASHDVLTGCASVIKSELRSIRDLQVARRAHQLLTGGHRLVRELTATRDPDVLAARIVGRVAKMFGAERVSLAVYDKDERTLKIAATHGFPLSLVQDTRIKPGEWVIGRVATTRKVLVIPDARLLPGSHNHWNRYRSQSFAVAPLFYGTETVGVLSITDRRDGVAFEAIDRIALRSIGALAGAAIVAADTAADMVRLERAASVDSVTGLLNRSFLDSRLNQEVGRSNREHTELAVLMADIDDFKSINDTYGHQVGDAVLKHVGEIIKSSVRVFDVCARYGGDEFAILMPNSDRTRALACAERIRQRTAEYVKGDTALPRLTISVGVAVGDAREGAADLVLRADRALYEAKASGKNSVRGQAGSPTAPSPVNEQATTRQDGAPASIPGPTTQAQLPYVLVADANAERREIYSAIAGKFRLGLLIARDGAQAQRLVDQFGPPVVLAVDLSQAEMSGASGLGRGAMRHRLMSIVAFSTARELREFGKASAPDGAPFAVLHPNSKPAVVRAVVERILQRRVEASDQPAPAEQAVETRRALEALTARGQDVVDTAGLAVYLKDGRDGHLRGVVKWGSDAALTRSQYFLPRVVDRVLTDGELVMLGDVGAPSPLDQVLDKSRDNTHGIVAAPVKQGGDVIGAICAFDDAPVLLSERTLTAFEQLGATGLQSATPRDPVVREADPVAAAVGDDIDTALDRLDAELEAAEAGHPSAVSAPPGPINDDPEWQPTLIDRQRGEFEVARELARARREQRQLSVVLFDVSERTQQQRRRDQNVSSGDTLQHVVDTFVRAVRQSDLPIRWSGNELLLVLPGLAGVEARAVADRVRAAMEVGGQRRVAVSGGVAELALNEQFGAAVSRARAKVAIALHHGNNRVS